MTVIVIVIVITLKLQIKDNKHTKLNIHITEQYSYKVMTQTVIHTYEIIYHLDMVHGHSKYNNIKIIMSVM